MAAYLTVGGRFDEDPVRAVVTLIALAVAVLGLLLIIKSSRSLDFIVDSPVGARVAVIGFWAGLSTLVTVLVWDVKATIVWAAHLAIMSVISWVWLRIGVGWEGAKIWTAGLAVLAGMALAGLIPVLLVNPIWFGQQPECGSLLDPEGIKRSEFADPELWERCTELGSEYLKLLGGMALFAIVGIVGGIWWMYVQLEQRMLPPDERISGL